jgi:hypothetical protein
MLTTSRTLVMDNANCKSKSLVGNQDDVRFKYRRMIPYFNIPNCISLKKKIPKKNN